MCNETTSSIQVYIQQWFHDEQGAKFCCEQKHLWACTYLLVGDLTFKIKLSRSSCRNEFYLFIFFVQLALVSCWKIFSSLPAESYNYNTKSWRRSSITSLQKQRPDVFTKEAVLKNSESLYCEIFKNTYFEDQRQTAASPFWSVLLGICQYYLWECFIWHTRRLYMGGAYLFLN